MDLIFQFTHPHLMFRAENAFFLIYSGMKKLKLGILRETKDPPDRRVPLTPDQCRSLLDQYSQLEIRIQPSDYRCFTDDEYAARGIPLFEDLGDCEVLIGVKEVKTESLLGGKTYLFFSHTAKKQAYNRALLQEVVQKGIRLVDYEYLTDREGIRVVAFGRWAGVVGAYNGLKAFGLRRRELTGAGYKLKPANQCFDLQELLRELEKVDLGSSRILVTGGGRVAGGAVEILKAAGVKELTPEEYLTEEFTHSVFTRLDPWHYARRSDRKAFDFTHFVASPGMYENHILPYARRTDLFMACHFWDPNSPVMLTRSDLASEEIPISLIADISCDINGPIASTIRASTIEEPVYGYDPASGRETGAFAGGGITVMAVDNLPGELPRDASTDFGEALSSHVLPELLGIRDTGMLQRASITRDGVLSPEYAYLADFLAGRE